MGLPAGDGGWPQALLHRRFAKASPISVRLWFDGSTLEAAECYARSCADSTVRLRLVQGPLGRSLADHAARAAAGEIAHPDAAAALCVFTAVMARGKIDMVAIEAALRG